jgi:mono/diheme cytochrome c family protein
MSAGTGPLLIVLVTMAARVLVPAQDRTPAPPPAPADQLKALKEEGQVIYSRECASCHGADGTSDGAGPALAGNTALANRTHVIRRILEGAIDKGMHPFAAVLNDREVAAVSTFVRNAWDNANGVVLEAEVKPVRDQVKKKP